MDRCRVTASPHPTWSPHSRPRGRHAPRLGRGRVAHAGIGGATRPPQATRQRSILLSSSYRAPWFPTAALDEAPPHGSKNALSVFLRPRASAYEFSLVPRVFRHQQGAAATLLL